MHGLLCWRSELQLPDVTSNPSCDFFPFYLALSSCKYPLNAALIEGAPSAACNSHLTNKLEADGAPSISAAFNGYLQLLKAK